MKAVLCWGVSATFAVKTGDLSRTPSSSWTLISLLTDLINSRSWQLSHFYHLSLFYGLISETSSSFTLYVLINIPPSLFSTLFFYIYAYQADPYSFSHSAASVKWLIVFLLHLRWTFAMNKTQKPMWHFFAFRFNGVLDPEPSCSREDSKRTYP